MLESVRLIGEMKTRGRATSRQAWSHAFNLLLSTDPSLRVHLLQIALAVLLSVFSAVLGLFAAREAGTPMVLAWTWALSTVAGLSTVFMVIRVGKTKNMPDPALGTLQISFCVTSAAIAYALLGPFRAAVFPALIVMLLFGLFALSPRMVAWISAYALTLFGLVMVLKAHHDPGVYVPMVEAVYLLVLSVMVPVVPLLTARYAEIRDRHHRQQNDFHRVRELASVDELTGLVNRRQMTLLLQRAQTRRARTGHPYCVAVVDLDYFKRVNDQYGHAVGDDVLRRFADVARAAVREKDTVARWGGEEFVILLSDTHLGAANVCIERLREHMGSARVRVGDKQIAVTLSGGIAEPRDGESFERALTRADDALYAAKARGRNNVALS